MKRKKNSTANINSWLQHRHNERMSGMALNSRLKRGNYRNGKERVQWQWQQQLWNTHLKWNQRTMKEGARNRRQTTEQRPLHVKPSKAQSMKHEGLHRCDLSKLFYSHTRLSAAQPNTLNSQCWNKSKQQESNNSYTTKTCKHYFTGMPQQIITTSHTTSRLSMGLHLHCPQKGQTSHLTRTWRDG